LPRRFELPGDLVAFGYEEQVVYPLRASIPPGLPAISLRLRVDFVACATECVPFTSELALAQPLGTPAVRDAEGAARLAAFSTHLPRALATSPEVCFRRHDHATGDLTLVFRVPGAADDLFFEVHPLLELGRLRREAVGDAIRFVVPWRRRDLGTELPDRLALAWTLAAADGGYSGITEVSTRPDWQAWLAAHLLWLLGGLVLVAALAWAVLAKPSRRPAA